MIDTGYDLAKCKEIILTMYKNKNLDYRTQQFMYILIEQPDKTIMPVPDYLYGQYVDTPINPADVSAAFPKTLFSKTA
jgi:hypothetical protein